MDGNGRQGRGDRGDKKSRQKLGLTDEMKTELLSLKKIKDPWSEENEILLKNFCQDVANIKIGDKSKSLVEYGTMLEASTKIFAAQADDLHQTVVAYREELFRSKKEKEAAKKLAEKKASDEASPKSLKEVEKHGKDLSAKDTEESEDLEKPQPEKQDSVDAGGEEEISSVKAEGLEADADTVICDVAEKNPATDSGIESEPSTDESHEILSDIVGPNTRKRAQVLSDILSLDENGEPVVKKKRNGIISLPPTLISCDEELEELQKSGLMCSDSDMDLGPPFLDLAVRLSRHKCVLYTEEKVKEEKKPHEIKMKVDKKVSAAIIDEVDPETQHDSNDDVSEQVSPPPQSIPLSAIAEGLAVSAANAAAFSTEDQSAIQECINELHYLPFTFELSKADLASAFNRTVERMSLIFQKNNVEVTRNMAKEVSVIACNNLVKEPSKPNGPNGVSVHPAVISLGDIYNTFVKSCREECETFMSNTKAILERTKEKSFAESRANIRAMIAELQRNIVPKFARVPLMAENTPEFFQHVTMFEKRMKKVLEEEAKKEEFDVRKYEREVLEVTVKESNELEGSVCEEMFLVPQSPVKSLSIERDIAEMMAASPSTRSSFDGSQSSTGGGWVPLRNIFHHMKNIDKTEAARLFYAVLALLSYQNLDMNYDQLYSAESAALLTKQLQQTLHTKEEDLDNKFHRGVKICTSRCPDIDKEEVFVSALTSESRDEAFRHLLAEGTNSGGSGSNPVAGSSSSGGRVIDEGIAEAMADFIEESGSLFEGRLESKKRKKKVDTS